MVSSILLILALPGCGSLFGKLRPDLDDSAGQFDSTPTVGGTWAERGLLSDDPYGSVGHTERSPASAGADAEGASASPSWVTQDNIDANRRDMYRSADGGSDDEPVVSSNNTPDMEPPVKRLYSHGSRATKDDFVDSTPNEGSLWGSDGQTNYYFTKNKIRSVGDIITINIEPALHRDILQEVKRTLNQKERDAEVAAAQLRMNQKALGQNTSNGKSQTDTVTTSAAAPDQSAAGNGAAVSDQTASPAVSASSGGSQDVPVATVSDIDVSKSLEVKPGDTIMAEIVERYPNGNYKIRGTKRVPYKNGPPRMVNILGVVRSTDISEDDVVPSGKLYEYRLEATH